MRFGVQPNSTHEDLNGKALASFGLVTNFTKGETEAQRGRRTSSRWSKEAARAPAAQTFIAPQHARPWHRAWHIAGVW